MNKKDVQNIIDWIRDYFNKNSFAKGAVVGMSGGKDSFVVAKLCEMQFMKDVKDSVEVTMEKYNNRSLSLRIKESLVRLVSPIL